MFELKPIDEETREEAVNLIIENWGSHIIVTKGKIHSARDLPGFIVNVNGKIGGLITCHIENGECEIVCLESTFQNQGFGTNLIDKVVETARGHNCKRVWLITTNDNTHAIRFYQKRGFNIAGIHINAIQESRKIKPQIPLYGFDNIPILHEIEFEKIL